MINVPPRCVCRSESLSAESRSVQSSPSYRLMKSRSESDLSQPESDEEGYTLVQHTLSLTHSAYMFLCSRAAYQEKSVTQLHQTLLSVSEWTEKRRPGLGVLSQKAR